MSHQMDGPARYQKPEESGMPHAQPTVRTMTALLRNAASVDTQKTKSLCCASAGTIQVFAVRMEKSSLTNKLPLSTQIVDCKGDILTTEDESIDHRQRILTRKVPSRQHLTGCFGCRNRIHQMIEMNQMVPRSHMSTTNVCQQSIQPAPAGYMAMPSILMRALYRCFTHSLARHWRFNVRNSKANPENLGSQFFIRLDVSKQRVNECIQLVPNQCRDSLKQSIGLRLALPSIFLRVKNRKSSSTNNSQNRPSSLRPVGSLLLSTKSIQHNKQCPSQRSYSQKCPDTPYAGDLHFWRHAEFLHASWLPAIKKRSACPFQSLPSMKEAA